MTARLGTLALLLVLGMAAPVAAYDAKQTFKKGAVVISTEAGYGEQENIADHRLQSGFEFWNAGVRFSMLPFEPTPWGPLSGSFEIGLEPFYQRYTEPTSAFFGGVGAVFRYHFLELGRVVPYVELFAAAGGTDLESNEIDSAFSFLLQTGPGVSVFVTDTAAVYAGYRFQHVSNGNTDIRNRGFEAHTGVVGVSLFFR
ncbi:MAG: acyloxyacyl hydrolase [Candidatus Rokubacteria bacterium]|nr:acyloxyacyl hydrolase [Candidatus Rokubacteria bacterium]